MMPASGDDVIRVTGGQVDEMVMALVDSAYDKDESVKYSILKALETMGQKQPNLVLSSCYSYIMRHKKIPLAHRVIILSVMEKVCNDNVNELEKLLVIEVIKQAVYELVSTKEVVSEWQSAACGIIVALGKHYHNEVMEFVLMQFQPGNIPHFYIVQTIANLATANPYGIVPFLKAVLSTMLPMLGMVKQDNMKWVFAHAISRFCESIQDYIINIDKAPDPNVKKEVFSSEINICYDILFNNWLSTRELKLKWVIVEALGHMSHLMSKDKIEEQLPKLISGILGLYRKHQDHYHITQCLCMLLESAAELSPVILSFQLDNILNALFPEVSTLPDYSQPATIKNHHEVLRCFDVIVKKFSDQLIAYLLSKIEIGQERGKIGALTVFKHLINSSGDYLTDKMLSILSGLKPILNEPNNKIKKVMAQVIVAMAHHGYLECPGSQVMLDFIIKQCTLPATDTSARRTTDAECVSNDALRSMCENVLHLLATTVEQMEDVLWPTLLEYLVLDEYSEAVGIICKCSAHLMNKKREEKTENFEINFNKFSNVPRPHAMLSRFMSLVGNPLNDNNRTLHILKLMKGISANIDKNLMALWDTVLPQLLQYVQERMDNKDQWSQKNWEDMVLKLLSKSLDEVDKEQWTHKLGNTMLSQLHLYNNYPDDKNMALKSLGIVMRKTANSHFISEAVDMIFDNIKHTNQAEREGCAVCIGLASGTHTDQLLVKMEAVAKSIQKKHSGILNFIKDMKGESEQEKHNATFILCYGFLCLYSPPNILVTRVETPILRIVSKFYNHSKDINVKTSLIRAIDLVAQALNPDNIMNETFVLKSRNELLNQMLSMIRAESVTSLTSSLKAVAINACASLLKLPPSLNGPTLSTMIQTSGTSVMNIPLVPHTAAVDADNNLVRNKEDYGVLLDATLEAFNNMLVQILLQDFGDETLEFIMQNLQCWLLAHEVLGRERSVSAIQFLLDSYKENLNSGNKVMLAFMKLGTVMGRLIPRCTDPDVAVRNMAVDCIKMLLEISGHNQTSGSAINESILSITKVKDKLMSNEPGTLYTATCDFAKILVDVIPSDQIRSFIFTLLDGLEDTHSQSSSGASLVLKVVLMHRGHDLRSEVTEIFDYLNAKISRINCPQTKSGALRCIHVLSTHHMVPVITSLLALSLPYNEDEVQVWKIIALDVQFAGDVLDHLLELLTQNQPYSTHQDPRVRTKGIEVKIANQTYAAVICSLTEIFRQTTMENLVERSFHKIFAALILALCSLVDVYPPLPPDCRVDPSLKLSFLSNRHTQNHPARWATDAFKSFLLCGRDPGYRIVNHMTDGNFWSSLEDVDFFPDGIAELARSLAVHCPKHMPSIVSYLNSHLNSIYENQRVGVVAFSAELINQRCGGDSALVELLMNSLISKLVDPSHTIRKLCIRGLSSIAQVGQDEVHKYSTTVLSAMMAGMDDRDDPENNITLEAMSGLSKVLTGIDENHIKGIQINIALKIRPMIEKDRALVRAAAITLFGDLSKVATGSSKGPYVEQIHNNFVSLLLHLNDSDSVVVKACKSTLKITGRLMDAERINTMFQKHLIEDRTLRYPDFINDLTKAIIADVPDKVNFYVTGCVQFFKSNDTSIQGNAILLAGCLLGNLPEELRKDISKEHICGALILLLKDSSPDVKMKVAEAMSNLYFY